MGMEREKHVILVVSKLKSVQGEIIALKNQTINYLF